MLQWEGRIVDNTNVQLLKAALPYLDQPVGRPDRSRRASSEYPRFLSEK